MTEKINEPELLTAVRQTGLPIVLYGMGNGADMVISQLEKNGLEFAAVFASDGFVRGQFFHSERVMRLSEVEEKYDRFVILMTFAVHDEKMLEYVKALSRRHTLFSPTVPIAGEGLFTYDFVKEHDAEFDAAYALLADDQSRKAFVDVINFKVSGKTERLFSCYSPKDEIYSGIFRLTDNESFVDLGAYDGDTIREFLAAAGGAYEYITAFEPDEKSFKKLERNTAELDRITLHRLGAWDEKAMLMFSGRAGRGSHSGGQGVSVCFDSVDNVIDRPVTLIKMDIEGAEGKALDGARQTIRRYRPKLYVCGYHRNEDMFALPLKIHELCPQYKIYFRQHPYIPAWEGNFYCTVD